jgi:hypothetical protein
MLVETMHWLMHFGGAVVCEVRVNAVTETRVAHVLGILRLGRIVKVETAAVSCAPARLTCKLEIKSAFAAANLNAN